MSVKMFCTTHNFKWDQDKRWYWFFLLLASQATGPRPPLSFYHLEKKFNLKAIRHSTKHRYIETFLNKCYFSLIETNTRAGLSFSPHYCQFKVLHLIVTGSTLHARETSFPECFIFPLEKIVHWVFVERKRGGEKRCNFWNSDGKERSQKRSKVFWFLKIKILWACTISLGDKIDLD